MSILQRQRAGTMRSPQLSSSSEPVSLSCWAWQMFMWRCAYVPAFLPAVLSRTCSSPSACSAAVLRTGDGPRGLEAREKPPLSPISCWHFWRRSGSLNTRVSSRCLSLIDTHWLSSDSCKGSGKLEKDPGYCSVSLPSGSPLVRFVVAHQFLYYCSFLWK